jgi:hypothetical protein
VKIEKKTFIILSFTDLAASGVLMAPASMADLKYQPTRVPAIDFRQRGIFQPHFRKARDCKEASRNRSKTLEIRYF